MPRTLNQKTSAAAGPASRDNQRITDDQAYLRGKVNTANEESPDLTWSALQRLNARYGVRTVTSSLRVLHGFPPPKPVRSVYAYLESLCCKQI
jgi:hypothetical protein